VSLGRNREWTRHSGRVWVFQVPFVTTLVFGHVRIVFAAHRYLAIWDAHYSADITKIAEKGGIWRRGLKFVVTGSQEQREGAAPDPEYPGSGAQKESRVPNPSARVIVPKAEIRS